MGNKVKETTSVKLGIYEISTDSQLAGMVGDVKKMEDGRKFRLCENGGGTLVPALLIQSKADTAYTENIVVATAAAKGDYTVTVTNFSSHEDLSENELKDGYFCVNEGGGELGHGRKIKANTAAVGGANTTLTFYEPLTDTITATSLGAWTYPLYNGVVIDGGDGRILGVPVCDVTVSTSTTKYYFWAQVSGPCPIIAGTGDVAAGDNVQSDDSGAVIVTDGNSINVVGTAMQFFDDGDAGWVWLNLE